MLCTTRELADALRVKPKTVYRMLKDGRIPSEYVVKMGKEWRFNLQGIEQHLLAQTFTAPRNP